MGDYLHNWTDTLEIRNNEAFILIPYSEAFEIVYDAINQTCKDLSIKATRADDIKQGLIMNNIFDGINHAEIIIADITGNNPNVFLELGIALARRETAVIVISQSRKEAPFDIRNWQVIQYSPYHLDKFKKDLSAQILSVKNQFGVEQLRSLLYASSPSDKRLVDPFISLIRKGDRNNRKMSQICHLISGSNDDYGLSESSIESINNYLMGLGDREDEKYKDVSNYLRVLTFSSPFTLNNYFPIVSKIFLSDWRVDPVTMKELPHREIASKICFRIIDMDHKEKKRAIDWILHYFDNKRMGRIDPVRAGIAGYLISSKDTDVNRALLDYVSYAHSGALESAIDICGQKRLFSASDRILSIMKRESNPFVVRSCFYALSRLENKNAAADIYQWMHDNRDKWGEQAVSSNLKKNAEDALKELDIDYYNKLCQL